MSALFFLGALLSGFLAVAIATTIALGNGAFSFLSALIKKIDPGVIHDDTPVSYTVAYFFIALMVALFISGFYFIGK
jgi:hypothetical protein